MRKLRNILIILLIAIILAVSTTSQAAKVEVTEENLKEAFKGLEEIMDSEGECKIDVTNDTIKITADELEFNLYYELKDKPTFTTEISITDGMSYEEFKYRNAELIAPIYAYIAVCNIQGVKYEYSSIYMLFQLMGSALSGDANSTNEYIIYDDTNTSDSTVPEANENQKIIKASEFDRYVMEYVNSLYKNTIPFKDSEGIKSFEWTIEQEDVTESSCKLVSTMSIDLDADFSKIEKLVDEMEDSINTNTTITSSISNTITDVITSDEKNNKVSNEVSKEINKVNNSVANIDLIPKAGKEFGINNILQIIIFISVLSIGIILITNKEDKK